MALHANVELAIAIEARGIDDSGADGVFGSFAAAREIGMLASGTVAALAIDAFRNCVEGGLVENGGGRRAGRICVVTEDAAETGGAAEVLLGGAIVARAHGPIAAL